MMQAQLAMRRCGFILVFILVVSHAFAAEPSTQPSTQPTTESIEQIESDATLLPATPDSIDQDLADAEARPAGVFKYGPVSLIDPLWDQLNAKMDDIGLKMGMSYTAVYQVASGGPGDRDAAGGDFDIFGDWRLLGTKEGENNGYLYFSAENRHELFTPIPPASLGGEIGSLWGTTNGFNEQDFALKELYWQQHFGSDRLIARIGKIDAENYYNSNYWQSDSKFFMNKAFSSFPVRAFPSNGLGINLTAKPSDLFYVSAGTQDAQGKKTTAGFDTLFEDWDMFTAGEIGFTPVIEGWGSGLYRFTGWYRAAGESDGKPHDSGFDLSFDQRIGPYMIPFFRYGWGEGNINGIEQMISAGVGWQKDLITEADVLGIAGSWGKPSDDDLDDQFATEIFYRLQVSPDNQFTVGYQIIIDPSLDPDSDVVGVFEMRWRIAM